MSEADTTIINMLWVSFIEMFHLIILGAVSRRQAGSNNVMTKKVPQSVQEWAQRACHRCLICLGDIGLYFYFILVTWR